MPIYQMNSPVTSPFVADEISSLIHHLIELAIKPNGFSMSGDFIRISVPNNRSIPADQVTHLNLTQV